jgi:hypothetical protein
MHISFSALFLASHPGMLQFRSLDTRWCRLPFYPRTHAHDLGHMQDTRTTKMAGTNLHAEAYKHPRTVNPSKVCIPQSRLPHTVTLSALDGSRQTP